MEQFSGAAKSESSENAELLHETKRELALTIGRFEAILGRIDSVGTDQLNLIMEMARAATTGIEEVATRPEWRDALAADQK